MPPIRQLGKRNLWKKRALARKTTPTKRTMDKKPKRRNGSNEKGGSMGNLRIRVQ